ncbi:hypothetical protein HK104_001725, partial [Borealophlyctis nickersoniae]
MKGKSSLNLFVPVVAEVGILPEEGAGDIVERRQYHLSFPGDFSRLGQNDVSLMGVAVALRDESLTKRLLVLGVDADFGPSVVQSINVRGLSQHDSSLESYLELLLANHGNPNEHFVLDAPNLSGRQPRGPVEMLCTVMHLPISEPLMKFLVSRGADINLPARPLSKVITASLPVASFSMALEWRHDPSAALNLLRNGATFDPGGFASYLVARPWTNETLRFLMALRELVPHPTWRWHDSYGNTFLHYAARLPHWEFEHESDFRNLVHVLNSVFVSAYQAVLMMPNNSGFTPMDVARSHCSLVMMRFLHKTGVPLKGSGNAIYHDPACVLVAASRGYVDMFQELVEDQDYSTRFDTRSDRNHHFAVTQMTSLLKIGRPIEFNLFHIAILHSPMLQHLLRSPALRTQNQIMILQRDDNTIVELTPLDFALELGVEDHTAALVAQFGIRYRPSLPNWLEYRARTITRARPEEHRHIRDGVVAVMEGVGVQALSETSSWPQIALCGSVAIQLLIIGCTSDKLFPALLLLSPPNATEPANGDTMLHIAAALSRMEALTVLLDWEDVDVTIRDKRGRIPLELLVRPVPPPRQTLEMVYKYVRHRSIKTCADSKVREDAETIERNILKMLSNRTRTWTAGFSTFHQIVLAALAGIMSFADALATVSALVQWAKLKLNYMDLDGKTGLDLVRNAAKEPSRSPEVLKNFEQGLVALGARGGKVRESEREVNDGNGMARRDSEVWPDYGNKRKRVSGFSEDSSPGSHTWDTRSSRDRPVSICESPGTPEARKTGSNVESRNPFVEKNAAPSFVEFGIKTTRSPTFESERKVPDSGYGVDQIGGMHESDSEQANMSMSLFHAPQKCDVGTLKELVKMGTKVASTDRFGQYALHVLAKTQNVDARMDPAASAAAVKLLSGWDVDINRMDGEGRTPLDLSLMADLQLASQKPSAWPKPSSSHPARARWKISPLSRELLRRGATLKRAWDRFTLNTLMHRIVRKMEVGQRVWCDVNVGDLAEVLVEVGGLDLSRKDRENRTVINIARERKVDVGVLRKLEHLAKTDRGGAMEGSAAASLFPPTNVDRPAPKLIPKSPLLPASSTAEPAESTSSKRKRESSLDDNGHISRSRRVEPNGTTVITTTVYGGGILNSSRDRGKTPRDADGNHRLADGTAARADDRTGVMVMERSGERKFVSPRMHTSPADVYIPSDINLTKLQRELDVQGLEIIDNQKESLQSRKKLAEQTRDFKKVPDDEKLKEFKNLLK